MTDRSIRSFALDYYRKRGDDVQPLAGEDTAAFAITPADGAKALKVTFADDVTNSIDGPAALTSTSPAWRAILDDLTADIAVSYRYLVSKPIGNAPRVLTDALPDGWAVLSAKLLGAQNRPAVGFSHRVTFDSEALNTRREVMHHHLWDVETGLRLGTMEDALYNAPTLMIRPENAPGEAVVKAFLDRSLGIVDVDTDTRGRLIEQDLKGLLGEVETRANQYYEQQMGQVLQREALLTDKLDATIKRIAEAKTADAIARLRQDGSALQNQLAHLRETREATLAAIEAACTRKLATERERHELTAMTDLVAICHASYDVVTYRAAIVPPNGQVVELDVRYWPVSREIVLPECPSCRGPMTDPRALEGGGIACGACVSACPGCGAVGDDDAAAHRTCAACDTGLCRGCETTCGTCGGASCATHVISCTTCAMALCARCDTVCTTCGDAVCRQHAHVDPLSGQLHCHAHRPVDMTLAPPAAILAAPLPVFAGAEDEEEAAELEAEEAPAPKRGWWSRLTSALRAEPEDEDEANEAVALTVSVPAEAEPTPVVELVAPVVTILPVAIQAAPVAAPTLAAPIFAPQAVVEEAPEVDVTPEEEADDYTRMAERAPFLHTIATGGPALDNETIAAEPVAELLAFTANLRGDKSIIPDVKPQPPTRVVNGLTGEAMSAKLADTCPACNDHFAVAEMVDCETCGVPACRRCASGELAPCPACESLQPTVAADPRLDFVFDSFPHLGKWGRAWEIAHVGPYVVTHWSRLGTWGMVVYHRGEGTGDDRQNVVVTDFSYGRLATLGQILSFGRRR